MKMHENSIIAMLKRGDRLLPILLLFAHLCIGPFIFGFNFYVRANQPEEINTTAGYKTASGSLGIAAGRSGSSFSDGLVPVAIKSLVQVRSGGMIVG